MILLAFASWLATGFLWGAPASAWGLIRTIATWLAASAIAFAFWRMKSGLRILFGLLTLAGLFLPNASIAAHPSFARPGAYQSILATLLFFWPSLALVMAVWLLHSGIKQYLAWRDGGAHLQVVPLQGEPGSQGSPTTRRRAGWTAAVLLALSGLLLAKTLDNLYWLAVWDLINDSMGILLLSVPVLAVLFSGLVLSTALKGRAKIIGLVYPLVTLALLFGVFAGAQRVDTRQMTANRAGQVSRAIETYYARHRIYPRDLSRLVPWTLLSIPEPVIIYGQTWCYSGGTEGYSLGYIDRDHWSSPILVGRVFSSIGSADTPHLCDAQMAPVRQNYPGYPWDYSMNGE